MLLVAEGCIANACVVKVRSVWCDESTIQYFALACADMMPMTRVLACETGYPEVLACMPCLQLRLSCYTPDWHACTLTAFISLPVTGPVIVTHLDTPSQPQLADAGPTTPVCAQGRARSEPFLLRSHSQARLTVPLQSGSFCDSGRPGLLVVCVRAIARCASCAGGGFDISRLHPRSGGAGGCALAPPAAPPAKHHAGQP